MNSALILAGGLGTRLRPLTYAMPKPLLPIGDKPLLEIIINNLKKYGITNIYLSVNYKKELIKSYFKNGKKFGVNIYYLDEKSKLGTAGPIELLKDKIKDSFVIINGDLFTDINIKEMYEFHKEKGGKLTIAVKDYFVQVPYGVLEKDDDLRLKSFTEKPRLKYFINAGIYMCNHELINLLEKNESIDMPDLWNRINQAYNNQIFLYSFNETWVDIGRMEDYLMIQEKLNNE